jgi:hypothetical protein
VRPPGTYHSGGIMDIIDRLIKEMEELRDYKRKYIVAVAFINSKKLNEEFSNFIQEYFEK